MLNLTDWLSTNNFDQKPWLVLGQGPTFSQLYKTPIEQYNSLGLNYVVNATNLDIAHIIDIAVLAQCQDKLNVNCRWLVMPFRPLVNGKNCNTLSLQDWINYFPVLRELANQGRLVTYDLCYQNKAKSFPEIEVQNFSSEAAFALLAKMGVKCIRSLGIDGGINYAPDFKEFENTARHIKKQLPFDLQFEKLEEITGAYCIDYQPLVEPMLVFVGTDESQLLATRVLTYSIHKYASRPARVVPLINVQVPEPKDAKNRSRTGFSFKRFAIPELAHYRGRALYVDSDMLVFKDLAELWNIDFGKQKILCTYQNLPDAWKDNAWASPGRQFSVMLLNCEKLPWKVNDIIEGLDERKYTYGQLLFECCLVKPEEIEDRIPSGWNCLERFDPEDTRLIHYTVVPTQPWRVDGNPLGYIWEEALKEATQAGWISRSFIEECVNKEYLRDSLAHCADLAPSLKPVHSQDTGVPEVLMQLITQNQELGEKLENRHAELILSKKRAEALGAELVSIHSEIDKLKIALENEKRAHSETQTQLEERIVELETARHNLYSSTTWKLGRIITKPAEILKKI